MSDTERYLELLENLKMWVIGDAAADLDRIAEIVQGKEEIVKCGECIHTDCEEQIIFNNGKTKYICFCSRGQKPNGKEDPNG